MLVSVLMLCGSYPMKLLSYWSKRAFPRCAFVLATAIAIISLAGASTACDSTPSPEAAECAVLCEASFWASASESEVKTQLENDPELSVKAGELGAAPLHTAASHTDNPAVIALLLDAGADIDIRSDLNNSTPLHMAAAFNAEPAVVELLLDRGAEIEAVNTSGATPLHVATALNRNLDISVLLLRRGANPAAVVGDGATSLHTAAFNPEPALVVLMLEHGGSVASRLNNGRTPLHTAALHNPNPEVHRVLMERGAEVNAKDGEGMTPLHSAAIANPSPLGVAALLLEYGADADAINNERLTACQLGVGRNVGEEVERLLCR